MLKKLDKTKFDTVYALLEESFPSDERRTYEGQKALLMEKRYAIYTYEENGEIRAAMLTWELEDFIFLEHFAVNPAMRNRGIGGDLLQAFTARQTKPVCLEVELPETEIAKRRIRFYERNGFYFNTFPYFQPPLSKGERAVPLRIMTSRGFVDAATFQKIKNVLYKEVYRCSAAETENVTAQTMQQEHPEGELSFGLTKQKEV